MIADAYRNDQNTVYEHHPLKTTALAYIREALQEERYEEIREMISIAREFGASEWDLRIAFIPGLVKTKGAAA